MAKVIQNDFNSFKIEGQAKLTDSQIASIETSTPNLKTGATYVVLPQIAVGRKMTVNDREVVSNRLAALEIIGDELNAVRNIGLSALRASYVGIAAEGQPKPELKMEKSERPGSEGLWRPKAGQGMRITTLDTAAPIEVRTLNGKKTAVIAAPFAFTVQGRKTYFQPIFTQTSDGRYDMEVDDNLNAKLSVRNDYSLKAVDASQWARKYSLAAVCPEMKEYAL